MSMVIMLLTFGFALLKLQHLQLKKNPDVVQFTDETAFVTGERYSITDNEFIGALSVENWRGGPLVDPRYVQFLMTNDVGTEDG